MPRPQRSSWVGCVPPRWMAGLWRHLSWSTSPVFANVRSRPWQRLQQEHGAGAILVLHRVGKLAPGEPIVLVAVQADRRGAAQRCSAALLEQLKHQAPFWKREWCAGQGTWLEANTPL